MTKLFTVGEIKAASNLDKARDMVVHNMENSDKSLLRGLVMLFAKQTADEQMSEHTKYHNKVGFSGLDGQILTSFAKQAQAWLDHPESRRFDRPLSPKQIELCRRKLRKYGKQLARMLREQEPVAVA